jgi:hypothetical protein
MMSGKGDESKMSDFRACLKAFVESLWSVYAFTR